MQITKEYITEKISFVHPLYDKNLEFNDSINENLKRAAVLIPLIRQNGQWLLLFTRRTDKVTNHKGQVAFPGGASDKGDETPEETALRESEEEIGVKSLDVCILGKLPSVLVTNTNYSVTPVIGEILWPITFRIQTHEVARVFTIPLLWLANRNNYWEFSLPGSERSVICYHPYDGELLWGATARMTVNFLMILGLLP